MLVKIVRDSIKKNPNAGSTQTAVAGPRQVSFTYTGALPACFKDGENCIVTLWRTGEYYEGLLDDESLLPQEALSDKNLKIEIDNNVQTYHHRPAPEWLYEYENPLIPCSSCTTEILLSEINYDRDDEGNSYTECPQCHAQESFEIEYESIEKALN